MARHRSFSSEFKRQLTKEFFSGRTGLHETLAPAWSFAQSDSALDPQVRGGRVHKCGEQPESGQPQWAHPRHH